MKKSCAFLTTDNLEGFYTYDKLLYKPFEKIGWKAIPVSWRDHGAQWDNYDAVIIRSPWDYQDDPDVFVGVLEKIDASTAHLENSLELVKWNLNKRYLSDLERWGIPIVPTRWVTDLNREKLMNSFRGFQAEKIVVKPVVGANADDTYPVQIHEGRDAVDEIITAFTGRTCMIQPFMNNITSEGEFSLFYFGNSYSHTILKTPEKDDFRVQEEHGGILKSVAPEPVMKKIARQIIDLLEPQPLYSRIDFVRSGPDGKFLLMELELIEPSLYFNMDPASPERFARVFDRWMSEHAAN